MRAFVTNRVTLQALFKVPQREIDRHQKVDLRKERRSVRGGIKVK